MKAVLLRGFKKFKNTLQHTAYIKALKNPIKANAILIESLRGSLLQEEATAFITAVLNTSGNFHSYIAVKNAHQSSISLPPEWNSRVTLIPYGSKQYCRLLASVKYLYNDRAFPSFFCKRTEQIYIYNSTVKLLNEVSELSQNHPDAIPFHCLNRIATVQKDLLCADYILCTGKSFAHNLCKMYQLTPVFSGTFLYPLPDYPATTAYNVTSWLEQILSAPKTKTKPNKKKKNVLIFCSDLRRNGMTTSLINLISLCDREKTNYFFTYQENLFSKNPERLDTLPKGTFLLPIEKNISYPSMIELLLHKLYFSFNIKHSFILNRVKHLYQRAYQTHFGHLPIDEVIHFTGYASKFVMLFANASAKRAIFAHNDMYEEYKEKKNFHMPTLLYAYENFERVIAVSNAVKESLGKLSLKTAQITVLENSHDDATVLAKAEQPFTLDGESEISMDFDKFKLLLTSPRKKFITIGRFSPEKGHKKLMLAFADFHTQHPDTMLIIIGGYGDFYKETLEYKNSLSCKDSIVIIKSVSNPFAVLKHCHLFLLPSDREPLGLVLLEADTLSVPIVATDIPGSGDFLKRFSGYLVENSKDGLLTGMRAFEEGRVKPLCISFEEYNREIVKRFEGLFEEV